MGGEVGDGFLGRSAEDYQLSTNVDRIGRGQFVAATPGERVIQ